jgi:hypothetical protein
LKPYFVKIAELSLFVKSASEWRERARSESESLKIFMGWLSAFGVVERARGRSDGVNPVASCRRDAQRWVRGHGRGEMFYIRLPVRGVGATAVKDRDVVYVGRGSVVWCGRFLYGCSVAFAAE